MSRSIAETRNALAKIWREVLLAIALLTGWLLITAGVARLTSAIAWLFSIGLLLLLLCGWRLVWRLFSDGLYDLSRERKRE